MFNCLASWFVEWGDFRSLIILFLRAIVSSGFVIRDFMFWIFVELDFMDAEDFVDWVFSWVWRWEIWDWREVIWDWFWEILDFRVGMPRRFFRKFMVGYGLRGFYGFSLGCNWLDDVICWGC